MTPQGAILEFAKMISQDLARGKPVRAALEAPGMMAQAGAMPDVVACLISEASKSAPQIALFMPAAFCFRPGLMIYVSPEMAAILQRGPV